ncbi:MAG: hypothetical protein ACI909_002462 [Planctomycetota bacterium]|jgi:hypothetical protein
MDLCTFIVVELRLYFYSLKPKCWLFTQLFKFLYALTFIGLSASVLANEPQITIHTTDKAPVIDGVLDDEAWKDAIVVTEFYQRVPVEGAKASEETEAYLIYDSDMLYIGVRMHDRDPDAIVARELRENEEMIGDDIFTVAIDSLLDRRNAFIFYMNANGTKSDARLEDNSVFRLEWDGIWYGATSRDDKGWIAEFAIPFKTLSLDANAPAWGLELERYIRRRNEFAYWANYDQNSDLVNVNKYGDLKGLENLNQGKGLDIKPQLASRYRRRFNSDDKDFTVKPGAEIIYKIKPSLNGSLIVNPDFSNATVDEIKTNLTRFDLFFPEQRDFFVRDADIFQFGGLSEANGIPFFSRRIGLPFDVENPEALDLDVGTKLSGRVGSYTVGLLNTQMGSGQGIGSKNLSVARVAKDIQEESRIGAMMTYGNPTSVDDNGLAGIDYRYRNSNLFGSQVLVADAYFMKSFSEDINNDEVAYGLTLDFPNDRWNARASYQEIQANFKPSLGFVNRSGIRQYTGDLRFRTRPDDSPLIRTIDWGFQTSFTTTIDNELESANVFLRFFDLESHGGDNIQLWGNWEHETLFSPFEIQPGVIIPTGDYDFYTVWGQVTTGTHRPLAMEVTYKLGEFYDGSKTDVKALLLWRPTPHFYITLEHQVFDVDLPQGRFEFEINRVRFNINLTPTLSWTNYVQQESETHFMTLQSQLRWIIVPGNELTMTINHDWAGENGSYKSTETDFLTRLVWTHRF